MRLKTALPPDSEQGQIIAKEFWALITEFLGRRYEYAAATMNTVNIQASEYGYINSFIEPALGVYFNNLGINPFEAKMNNYNRGQ